MQYEITQKSRTSVEIGLKFNLENLDQIKRICKDWLQRKQLEDTEDNWGYLRMCVKSEMVIFVDGQFFNNLKHPDLIKA